MSEETARQTDEVVQLEAFDAPDGDQVTTFETDEVTARCPFSYGSGRDFYDLTLRYVADEKALEGKSFRDWIRSLDNEEMTAETLAHHVHESVSECIDPEALYVRLEQNIRGGIKETVEEGDDELRR